MTGHGAFFPQRAANTWTGACLGVLTLTPFDYGSAIHAGHHATSSNLDRRGTGRHRSADSGRNIAPVLVGRMSYRVYRSAR